MYNGLFVSAIICAAGASTRMGLRMSKQLLSIGGRTVIERTVGVFESHEYIDEVIIVCPENAISEFRSLLGGVCKNKPVKFTAGGSERQISVHNGVMQCDPRSEILVIHDGARPFVPAELVSDVISDGARFGCSTLAVAVKDTIKTVKNGTVTGTPPREELYAVQTPQVFRRDIYVNGYEYALQNGINCTDDCRLAELTGGSVHITKGDYNNIKITTIEDIRVAEAIAGDHGEIAERGKDMFRVGHGYDVHKLGENRRLIIGGVNIPYERGLVGHSDADVLTHAIMDALLGAAALGDIGGLFPDNDPKYEGADSILLLKEVCAAVTAKGYTISNIDATVVAQKPKLKPYIEQMRSIIADGCALDIGCVNIKATTEEKLGFTGREEGISAHAVCLLYKDL